MECSKAGSKNSSHPSQRRRMHNLEVERFAERKYFGSWQAFFCDFGKFSIQGGEGLP